MRDALVARGEIKSFDQLPKRALIGTSSLRRQAQLLAARPDLVIEPIRGNVDTRLRKLRDGEFDAIVLAMAGLNRTKLFDRANMQPIPPEEMLPAPGQGAP